MGSLSLAEDVDALVHAALAGGDAAEYAHLVGRVASPRLAAPEARQLLLALARRASAASEERHGELLAAALRVRWADDAGVAEAYALLAQDLIARSAAFAEPFLASVVGAFASTGAPLADDVSDVAHGMLRGVLFSCPLAARALCDLIHARFPHRRLPTAVHVHYLGQLLRLLSYEHHLAPALLPHALQQILALDAEASMPPSAQLPPATSAGCGMELEAEWVDETVFRMDDMAEPPPLATQPQAQHQLEPDAEKLDALLALLFDFWQRSTGGAHAAGRGGACGRWGAPPRQPLGPQPHPRQPHGLHAPLAGAAGGAAASGAGKPPGEMLVLGLLAAFDGFIVRSQAVQAAHFALLLLSAQQQHSAALLAYFAAKLGGPSEEPFAVRQACVGYAASYGCSAALLDAAGVQSCVGLLAAYGQTLAQRLQQGAAQQQHQQAQPLRSPGAGVQPLLAAQRGLVCAACGCALVLERRWALWAAAYLRQGQGGEGEALLGSVRRLLELDPALLLGAMHPATAAFARQHILGTGQPQQPQQHPAASPRPGLHWAAAFPALGRAAATPAGARPGTPRTPSFAGPGSARAAGVDSRAAYAAAAGFCLPFEEYPPLPESGQLLRHLILAHPPAHAAAARLGARRSTVGSAEEEGSGSGCGSHASDLQQQQQQQHAGHEGCGSLRLPASLGGSGPRHGLSPLAMGSSPLRALPYLGAGGRPSAACAFLHGRTPPSSVPLPVRVRAPDDPGRLSAPDNVSLADSLTNQSMSFSPDELESHIRMRFEECKRVAVREGGSPGSSPPLNTYVGFDGLPRTVLNAMSYQ